MAVAAAFLWSPTNYKRMLAYSSVEHLGIVSLGLGFGGAWGLAGAMLHIANHALAKSVLFLVAGRIREEDRPKDDMALVRLKAGGGRDHTFAAGGRALTDVAGGSDAARDLAIATNGKIVVTGEATVDRIRRVVVARYLYS